MKKILLILTFLIIGIVSCTPVKYVMVDPKDSTKLVEVRKRIIYDDEYYHIPMYFNYNLTPYYNPIIIRRYNTPRIQIQRPSFRPPSRKR